MKSASEIKYRYIIIEGNIGSGKTTLTKKMCERFNAKGIFEQFVDNPFLPRFYENPERYALQLELSFLVERFRQLKDELESSLFHQSIIADYYLKKSLVFAAETLNDDDYKLYSGIFHTMFSSLPRPDLYIYLHQNPDKLLKNIAQRGRTYESNISEEYLLKIQQSYFRYFKQVNEFPIVVIDCYEMDFVKNETDMKKLLTIPEMKFKNGYQLYEF
jgi:deoxyadenosine/deoxycytidine kinase